MANTQNIEGRRRLARAILSDPTQKLEIVAGRVGIRHANAYAMIYRHGDPSSFLRQFGAELATQERIDTAMRGCFRGLYSFRRKEQAKVLVSSVQTNRTFLGAHQCQALVGERVFCGKPVVHLYCIEHDRIAKKQERERFPEEYEAQQSRPKRRSS